MTKILKTERPVLKAEPEFNYMFLTCNKTKVRESGIIMTGGSEVLDEQVILKVGPTVGKHLKPGMTVKLNPIPYMVRKLGDKFTQENNGVKEDIMREAKYVIWPVEEVDGLEVMWVPDNHIRWHYPIEE